MVAFGEAVAAGDYEKAEGWLAVARFSKDRIAGADAVTREATRRSIPARHRHAA